MGDLQEIDGANDFYHAPILMLSSGFERVIKSLLCLANWDENELYEVRPFPNTHDIKDLLDDRLLPICHEKNYSQRFPAAKADIDFLSNNIDVREIIGLLSDFAQGGRYYHLDVVLNGESRFEDPYITWSKIETAITKTRPDILKLLTNNEMNEAFTQINKELIIRLEKFARALSRLFTLADFGDFAKQISPKVYDFLMLRDEQLGNTQY